MNTPTTFPKPSILQFKKAQYVTKKARIGLSGPSGSGKTLTALKIAGGLTPNGGRLALIDTENNSSVLYADRIDFDVLNIEPPFDIDKYINAIKAAEQGNYAVLILDSISHAWAGEGGLLDTQGKLADGGMNSFTAWRKLTPKHNAFVEAMIRSKLHVIATMRSKMDYIVEQNDKGKAVPKKVGLAPIQREGMDYEFDIVFDLDLNHNALSSKDRSSLFDGRVLSKPDERVGQEIGSWLNRNTTAESTVSQQRSTNPSPVSSRPSASQPEPHPQPALPSKPNLFDNNGHRPGEQETNAMLFAVKHAATAERLFSIEQSMSKGLNAKRITAEQADRVKRAIQERNAHLARQKAA
ncbi:MAG: ATP-binding protein [Bacteroidetes bacterium]|nr:ATP-binding protein [Bacteroidota bacterium]MCW5896758.1 ATP-binding protein [Bacteroidota bacterium]